MPPPVHRSSESWVAGSWRRPLLVTLAALITAVVVIHRHRDAGSVLAALVALGLATWSWCLWWRGRRDQPPNGTQRKPW